MAIAEITVPTNEMSFHAREQHEDFYHLMPHLREGKVRPQVFARENRERIAVDSDVREGGGKVASAREIKKATEMGVRGKGRSMGAKAPLQPHKKKGTKEARREEAVEGAKKKKLTKRERKFGPDKRA